MIFNPQPSMFTRSKGAAVDERLSGNLGLTRRLSAAPPPMAVILLIVFLRTRERALEESRELVVLSVETGNTWI